VSPARLTPLVPLHHRAAPLVGRLMRVLTADWEYSAVGGLTLGADPVADAVLHAVAAEHGADPDVAPVDAFVVRKSTKEHGMQRLIEGPDGFRSARERRLGFEDALRGAGLTLPRSLIARGNYTFETGVTAAERLLDLSPRPTAIFASNDEMAAGVVFAARERGISVPEELSVIGFDDTPIAAHIWPPLTTVRWPIVSMARLAARKLVADMVEGSAQDSEPCMLPSMLVRRASVAPPPG